MQVAPAQPPQFEAPVVETKPEEADEEVGVWVCTRTRIASGSRGSRALRAGAGAGNHATHSYAHAAADLHTSWHPPSAPPPL
jgi:hypothetical protein